MKYCYLSLFLFFSMSMFAQSGATESEALVAKKDWSNDQVYKVVEQMPRFPGCEELEGSEQDRKRCASDKLFEYISENLVYPEDALKQGIEGMAVVSFVIRSDSSVTDVKIVRDLAGGCGDSAASMVEGMNDLTEKWIPGSKDGENVSCIYTLPVTFRLKKK
ncbi:energy transducer TonB [Portibacter lacus]|nr:energy transducer TonB [Portibacter lacus]